MRFHTSLVHDEAAPPLPAPRRGPYRPRDRHVHGPLFVAIIIASAVGLWHDAPPIAAVAGPAATTVVGLVLTRWRLAAVDDPIDDNSIYLRDAELHRTQSSNLCGFAQYPSIAIAKLTDPLGIDPSDDDPRRLIDRLRQWTVTIVGGGDNGRHSSVREVLARWQAAFQNRRFDFTTVRIAHRFCRYIFGGAPLCHLVGIGRRFLTRQRLLNRRQPTKGVIMEFRSRAADQPLSRKRRRTAAKGRRKGMHDPDIVIELMSATSNVKSIRNTFATARAFCSNICQASELQRTGGHRQHYPREFRHAS
jgi:hypothetical protein